MNQETKFKEVKGSDYLLLERVCYGKESTPVELREYKLYRQSSGVGTIKEWLDLASQIGKEGVRALELNGDLTFHDCEVQ